MSDLQFILIALGVVIILCVLLYNWWQERKFRLEMASTFIEPKHDVLIDNFAINTDTFEETELIHSLKPYLNKPDITIGNQEKQLASPDFNHLVFDNERYHELDVNNINEKVSSVDNLQFADIEEVSADAELYESDLDSVAVVERESTLAPVEAEEQIDRPILLSDTHSHPDVLNLTPILVSPKMPSQIDIKIDLVAVLNVSKNLSAEQLNYALNQTIEFANECDKSVQLMGFNVQSYWDVMQANTALNNSYTQLLCCLQLANRDGAASRMTINRFQHAVEMLGMEIESPVKWLNNDDPLAFSKQLDEFCIEVDKIIGFHIVKGDSGAFHGTKLRGLAEAGGFNLAANGIFYYQDTQTENKSSGVLGSPLFSLLNQNNQPFTSEILRITVVNGVTFQMDIPHVKNCPHVFNQMVSIAQKMQQSLGGLLVDDHQKPLTPLQINKISQQLHTINSMMQTFGVASGTPTAMRLFS